ncbi:hypothetical protein MLD38_035365 [Melastoma candidum]|uniref:Uncharacterized protein n=1 Tax=Melastoma candidum TaxID=119954 RepID=A0ACB9LGX8_9MYRT|nr:hypothetical protein MLD38_035365 [Melastoma candidum]
MVPTPNPGGQVGDRHCGGEWFFHSNTPHFFKIILPRDVRNLNLRIPVKFVRNHGSALSSDLVFLEVPSGSLWKVKLLRDEHGVLLQDGCAAFIKHYNIRPGQFLVFRHDSGSRFRVVIFDETACEITYRIGPDQDRDKGDELLQGPVKEERLLNRRPNVTGRKRKPDPPPECPNNVKVSRNKRRGASLVNVRGASGPARPTGLPSQVSAKASDGRNAEGEAEGHLNSSCINFSPGAEVAQRSGALSRATSLRCEGPSFFVIVQPTLVHPNFLLRLPKKFSSMFSSKLGLSGEMRLMVSRHRRIWTVSYVNHGYCCIRTPGWKEFVVDNDLEVGDVCVFELLTGQIGITFRVTIFHSQGVLSSSK